MRFRINISFLAPGPRVRHLAAGRPPRSTLRGPARMAYPARVGLSAFTGARTPLLKCGGGDGENNIAAMLWRLDERRPRVFGAMPRCGYIAAKQVVHEHHGVKRAVRSRWD
ncbi:hypothetical protein B0T21DRAFT_13596 [Apiosordaria backusii]|uniref:Uncharacterized protein n=1 Tax=Apiosordaria backusii TaxID=314023 RepID=A0AA40K6M6_9PEZI|nr:hypothetical protein B0T21DRAFT_13596 [Apiosordaria backusii]